MVYVSVSAYMDANLLAGCLASIRAVLPDADIAVVDGKYETWPDGRANSTDDTAFVASTYGATYVPGGPYDRECDKHVDRVARAPDGERALFLDADERLLTADVDALEAPVAYQPRIANALVYGPRAVYWPRSFYPETVEDINRWDAYQFSVACQRTDAITIVHRHDLRDRSYREQKYERFATEGRQGRYEEAFETYLEDDWNAIYHECPACGADSVTRTQWTDYDDTISRVEVCVAGDRCYAARDDTGPVTTDYLPDDYLEGFQEDPAGLRAELMAVDCPYVFRDQPAHTLVELEPIIARWIEDNLRPDSPPVYDQPDRTNDEDSEVAG